MTTLPLQDLTLSDHLVHPEEFSDVRLDSPALLLLTDFRHHQPMVIDGGMRAVDAEAFMRASHTRLRLVVDQRDAFVGLVTLDDLSERRLIKKIAAGETRYHIHVRDLMQHRHELRALRYQDLTHCTVQDVLETLEHRGEHHCLVVDTTDHGIRGLIAASDVARRLHMEVRVQAAPTFADICAALHPAA